ncbi:MAG: GNAT family N-acetyltransferase [Pedobacter sp.]
MIGSSNSTKKVTTSYDILDFNQDMIELISPIITSAEESHHIKYPGESWFRWKFSPNPFGSPIIKVAIGQKGMVAGVVAFSKAEVLIGEKTISAAYSTETFVHPSSQGKGLFSILLDSVQKSAQLDNIELLYNFPNTNSRHGFLKKDWSDVGGVDSWILPTRPANFFGTIIGRKFRIGAIKADKSFGCTPSDDFNMPESEFFPLSKCIGGLAMHSRSSEFLAWRYNTCPLASYLTIITEEGWAIIRPGNRGKLREAQLLDIFSFRQGLSQFEMRRLLSGIISEVKKRCCVDFITFYTSRASGLSLMLSSLLFLNVPNHINFFNLSLVSHQTHPGHWLLTGSDFHTY